MIELLLLSAATVLAEPIATLEPWIGRCWTTRVAPDTKDTHCFTRVYGGAHVRDRHRVVKGGKAVYAGETLYSVEGRDIVFLYVSSIGGIGRGTATPVVGGMDFAMIMRATPDARAEAMSSQWRWTGPTSYSVRNGNAPELVFDRDGEAADDPDD